MVDLVDLTNAFVDTLQRIPELVADLADASPASVVAYLDENPRRLTTSGAIYQQKPGTVLVVWREMLFNESDEMSMYQHMVEFYARAKVGGSVLKLATEIVNGTPVPGDGQRWKLCGVMPGVLPSDILDVVRETDSEGIDYIKIITRTNEIGDA